MEKEITQQLDELLIQINEKGEKLDTEQIERHLVRYNDFILNIRSRLEEVIDAESFRVFRNEWKETGGIRRLPAELSLLHQYQSLVEQYNALIVPLCLEGKAPSRHKPIMITESELNIRQSETILYKRPFQWEQLKERLTGQATKNAIYIHAVACLDTIDIINMIEEGSIKQETIEALPYAVTERGVTGGSCAKELREAYHANLATLYQHFGKILPKPVFTESPLKGVTFDGRTEKLLYIHNYLNRENLTAEKHLQVKLERYTYQPQEGPAEPAIRVLATLPHDKQCRNIDIGNIDRNLAIQIAKEHPDATLICHIKEFDLFDMAGSNGTKHQPFMKLVVEIADKPREIEKEKNDYSDSMDTMFHMEELR